MCIALIWRACDRAMGNSANICNPFAMHERMFLVIWRLAVASGRLAMRLAMTDKSRAHSTTPMY